MVEAGSREDHACQLILEKMPISLWSTAYSSVTMTEFKSDEQIRKLATRSLFLSHLDRQFEARGFLYEGINDKAQGFYKKIASAISSGNPLAGQALKAVIDIVGDVVTTARNTSTAKKILNKLRKKILESYKAMHQLVLVSHSLGTIYSLDTINELIRKDQYFDGDDRQTWPVQGTDYHGKSTRIRH